MGRRGGHSHRMTAGRGASAIDRLTSIPQMNRWLRNQDWFQPGSQISLNGVDLEAARGIAKAYQQVFDRYPQLKGIFSGIKSFNLGSGTYADCNLATGQIRVSNTMYRRLQELERSYARDIRANWHPAGTDWAAILTHEIGHAIDGYITQHSEGGLFFHDWHRNSSELQAKIADKLHVGTSSAEIARQLSRYGATNTLEWFAESFAEGMRSENPRPMAREFMLELDKILRRLR